jgi:hypothetical protein
VPGLTLEQRPVNEQATSSGFHVGGRRKGSTRRQGLQLALTLNDLPRTPLDPNASSLSEPGSGSALGRHTYIDE